MVHSRESATTRRVDPLAAPYRALKAPIAREQPERPIGGTVAGSPNIQRRLALARASPTLIAEAGTLAHQKHYSAMENAAVPIAIAVLVIGALAGAFVAYQVWGWVG